MKHLPFRRWCRHYIKGRGWEEDCPKATEGERERSSRDPFGLHAHVRRQGRKNDGAVGLFVGGQRKNNESSGQHGAEEVDGIMDMTKADGVVS